LRSIWGLDAKRIFAVGEDGLFLGYDGKRWAPAKGPPSLGWKYENNGSFGSAPMPTTFVRVGGLPDGTLYVTNAESFVHTGLPGKWTSLFSGNPSDPRPILSIWATDATHMILLDSEYMNVRRGGPWESCTLGQGTGVRALWGTDAKHLWGAGFGGALIRIDPEKLVHGEPCVAGD
ncbi:MAG: hypothetical protein HOV80_07790, partial [Polyangiaceae bacterium]|nr:hypothetical protein [Polyangiaceae bacterium]